MTKKDLNRWIMYHEIHKLRRMGFSISRIARYFVMNPRTVSRHLKMSEDDFEQSLINLSERKKILNPYEVFVKGRLSEFPDTSSAQIHDWLKENYSDCPEVSTRTVYNYVAFIRQKHNIPYQPISREFSPVEELPYGKQSQVDFGEYNMRLSNGKRKKVYFFAMVLSRSRMKFTWFSDKPFTSQAVVTAHEEAFSFFGGIPKMVVYDQDRTMVVDENLGDIILTSAFKQYTKARNFELHFCRKSDPQSKGKVENVIQYIKKNFLYNRAYHDIETLNDQAVAWLNRTANYLPHNYTKKSPQEEFIKEKQELTTFIPLVIKNNTKMKEYYVRKNNVIAYKSNFYSLPMGTYQGLNTKVLVKHEQDVICILDLQQNQICSHQVSLEKGKPIINTHHRRDNSQKLQDMIDSLANCFTNKDLAKKYLLEIKQQWPRYTRDHLQVIQKALSQADINIADKTLDFCRKNEILHGYEFEQALFVLLDEKPNNAMPGEQIKLLGKSNLEDLDQLPQTSNIEDYENIINHNKSLSDDKNRCN
ncbi:MAG: IS21 family transposase [Nanoarchaeota archaeon]|nr:IS21 family transposase [Nanoarchaeota archaeon]